MVEILPPGLPELSKPSRNLPDRRKTKIFRPKKITDGEKKILIKFLLKALKRALKRARWRGEPDEQPVSPCLLYTSDAADE